MLNFFAAEVGNILVSGSCPLAAEKENVFWNIFIFDTKNPSRLA